MLVSVDRYRDLSGDLVTPDVDLAAALAHVEGLIEVELRRPLASAQRTETLRVYGNRLYPAVTPVTVVENHLDIVSNGVAVALHSSVWLGWGHHSTSEATITYTGGWTPETLPLDLAQAIVDATQARVRTTDSEMPYGATSVAVGDVRVTYDQSVTRSEALPASVIGSIAKYRRTFL